MLGDVRMRGDVRTQFSSTLASFPLLADCSSVKLTSEKAIKAAEDCKYLTYPQNLPDASFNLSRAAQTAKISPDNDTVQPIRQVTHSVLAAEIYAMAHGFDIEKRHWGRYQIVRAKSYQHKHYGIGGTSKYKQANRQGGNERVLASSDF